MFAPISKSPSRPLLARTSGLRLARVTETVTVTEQAPLMKTESGEISHTLTTNDINQLPVLTTNGSGGATGMGNIRNPLQEIILLPGTFFQNDTAMVINGAPANSENIRIEGQDSVSNIWKIAQQNSQGGVDAIQEVSVQTSNFNAEYGNAAGGYFNYTMKSGTNTFHGSAYDYFVNEVLDAGTPFTTQCVQNGADCGSPDTEQHIRNRIRRNDYGFTLGGPVDIPKVYNGKNKTFFFFNFEQFRQGNLTGTTTTTVPTAAYRSGNFRPPSASPTLAGPSAALAVPVFPGRQLPRLPPLARQLTRRDSSLYTAKSSTPTPPISSTARRFALLSRTTPFPLRSRIRLRLRFRTCFPRRTHPASLTTTTSRPTPASCTPPTFPSSWTIPSVPPSKSRDIIRS